MSRNSYPSTGPPNISNASDEPFFVEIDTSPPHAPSAGEESGKPAWFQGSSDRKTARGNGSAAQPKRPAARTQKSARKRGPIVETHENEPGEELTWQEQIKRWMYGEGGAGYGVSVLVHVVLLLIMSFIIYSRPTEKEVVITAVEEEMLDVAAMQDVEIVDFEEDVVEQIKDPTFEPAPLSATDLGVNMLALTSSNTKGGGLDLKIPSTAVTKGSFTVWTVPEDPRPGEQYKIMIRIKLDRSVKRYPRRDLAGNVVGTDGYKDYFGGPTEAGYIAIQGDSVQLEACKVPGAAMLVKDVITVESKILKEKQVIELVF